MQRQAIRDMQRQAIRDIAIRFYADMLGYTQAIRLIDNVIQDSKDASLIELSRTTKLDLKRFA